MLNVEIKSSQRDHVGKRMESKDDHTTELYLNTLRTSKAKEFAARKNHSLNQTISDKNQADENKSDLSDRSTFSFGDGIDEINTSGVHTLFKSDESGIRVILEKCEESERIDDLMKDIRLEDSINESCFTIDPTEAKDNDLSLDAATFSKCSGSPPSSCTETLEGVQKKSYLGITDHSLRKSKSFDETQSDRRQRPLVKRFAQFVARKADVAGIKSITYAHSREKTSKNTDDKHETKRQRYRRQASEPKKSNIHPEKRHPHKRQSSDPISQKLKKNDEPALIQSILSRDNSIDCNTLSITHHRRAWASTSGRSTDESPTLLLRRKFANSRATSMPESSRHPLAFENTSFDENESHIPIEPVVHPVVNVDEVFARCNVQDWSLEDLLIEEKKIRLREYSWILNHHNQVFGAEEIIHLPRKLSIVDRNTFEKVRYVRRNAIHIYDRNEFKQILKRHIIRKHAFSYEY